MEGDLKNDVVYSQNITEFVIVAGEYCTFVENTLRFSKKDFLEKSGKLLPLIYLKTNLLPRFESIFDDGNEKFVSEEEWDIIHDAVQKKLGLHDDYREVFDPLTHEQLEQSTASISDSLADIYQDLKNFITLYNIGTEELMNDALWECQLNFEEFWGQKLLNVLKAIHNVYFGEDDLEEDEGKNTEENNVDGDIDTSNWILSKRQADYRKGEE
ncbi:MAG: DUF5063 domain-containing protein [Bacteroidales bacterium]|jgi:hypothetical protein|nr:DUF5063 domain-containing protein [Bacteroidales bacterium]